MDSDELHEWKRQLQEWADRRAEAKRQELYRTGASLGCRVYPYDFEMSEDSGFFEQRCKRICARCPVVDICLEEALRNETGVKASNRFGVIAGLNPEERVAEARSRGCPVCAEPLPTGGKSLYCKAHATRSGRVRALSA